MADDYLRQSPLAHLGLEGRAGRERGEAGVAMGERPFPGIVDLRGRPGNAAFTAALEPALGFALPSEPGTSAGKAGTTALWLGPDEWWLLAPDAPALARELAKALEGLAAAVTEVGESRTCLRVAGPKARDLLVKGCPLDLHPRRFGPGACAQSLMAKADVLIHQVSDEPAYDLYVVRSFADYVWRWLEDAAREYGLAVVAG